MHLDHEMGEVVQSIADRSAKLVQDFYLQPQEPSMLIGQFLELTKDYQHFLQEMFSQPEKLIEMQMNYWQDALQLMNESMTSWIEKKPIPTDDKRFHGEDWTNNPFFNVLSHQYLLATNHIQQLVSSLEYKDESTEKRLKFFSQQYLDALSPSNYLMTNPAIMNETIQSGGKNLLKGLENLLRDLDSGEANLSIQMTDKSAFEVGGNIATTPGKVIYQNDLMQLIQFSPATDKVKKTPLLIVPPWINKYYILDLSEKNSFIKWLVSEGITVFVISWVNPDSSHAKKGLADYMSEGPLSAVEQIQKQLNVPKVNTLGFCIGGTLLAITLSYLKEKAGKSINSATFLTSLIDFSEPGDIGVFIDEKQIAQLEAEMAKKGFLSGKHMASTFNSLRANDLVWSFFIKNYLHGKESAPFDILYWNADSTNMPATMHSEYLRKMYLNNELIQPNKIELLGQTLDVSQIDIPSFFVSTKKDHIAPWKTTYNGFNVFKGPKQFLLGGSGHIAGIINHPEKHKYGYYTHDTIVDDADKWLDGATYHEGSWWPQWSKWLKKMSGTLVNARDPEKGQLPVIEDAPGSYVKSET